MVKLLNFNGREIYYGHPGKKQITYKRKNVRLSDFLRATLYISRKWNDTFKIFKGRICEPRILGPAKTISKYKGHR